jgi:hypothetical protein
MGGGGDIWVGNRLDQPGSIAQIDKGHPAVIPPSMHPPSQSYFFPHILAGQESTLMSFVHCRLRKKHAARSKKPGGDSMSV